VSRQAELIPSLKVAAGILVDQNHQVLVAERVGGGPFQGMWEFPGGKIKAEETPSDALMRELLEEIGIQVLEHAEFMRLEHSYPDRHVDLCFFLVTEWSGEARGLEGQALQWVSRDALSTLPLLPADRPVIEALLKR
jgi:8-oxo-dGTP diphosphatase